VFLGGPPAHVGANLSDQTQRTVGANGVDLGEIDAGEVVERGANLEPRLIVARLLPRAGRGDRAARRGRLRGEDEDVGLDRGITRRQLRLIGFEEREVLLQDEDVLRTVVSGEGLGDLGLRGLTPVVPMLREGVGIRLARDDVPENAQAGDAGDVADHDW